VTVPLEEAINGVSGLRYIQSSSGSDGSSQITATFNLDRNLDQAANDVQNAVNGAQGRLPNEVKQIGVTVSKNSGTFVAALGITSTDKRWDQAYLTNFLENNVVNDLKRINGVIADSGYQYRGTTKVKHLLWMIVEDVGLDQLRPLIKRKLTGLNVAPFYGCYILRPEENLGLREKPARSTYLENIIELIWATPVEYLGTIKCCWFPMLTFNPDTSLKMAGKHLAEAKSKGADVLVTPCPLCHLNLDGQQPDAEKAIKAPLGTPIFHLPQLLGLAFGFEPADLRLNHHVVNTKLAVDKVELKV